MSMWTRIQRWLAPETVYAHCDIPCGIYDPHAAQVAAHTVVRMMDLIGELGSPSGSETEVRNKFVRYVASKEEHAELVKHEVRILWGDYFKPEHLKIVPDLHDQVWNILKLASKCRQSLDAKAANDLLAAVNKFAESFWKTKGKETTSGKAAYPTEKPIVVPKLG